LVIHFSQSLGRIILLFSGAKLRLYAETGKQIVMLFAKNMQEIDLYCKKKEKTNFFA
jgi:hypothetical protein